MALVEDLQIQTQRKMADLVEKFLPLVPTPPDLESGLGYLECEYHVCVIQLIKLSMHTVDTPRGVDVLSYWSKEYGAEIVYGTCAVNFKDGDFLSP